MENLSAAVGAFVRTKPVATDYALYAEFNGNHQTGLNELRAVVVDKAGEMTWMDRLTPQDEAFRKFGPPRLIRQAGLCDATEAGQTIVLKASLADPNELKALWGLAREFRVFLRSHPPEADYAIYADYAFNPQKPEQGFVHFVVCDRKGEWVIVDMQNSHHRDYQSIGITSRERCDKLLVKRLEGYLN